VLVHPGILTCGALPCAEFWADLYVNKFFNTKPMLGISLERPSFPLLWVGRSSFYPVWSILPTLTQKFCECLDFSLDSMLIIRYIKGRLRMSAFLGAEAMKTYHTVKTSKLIDPDEDLAARRAIDACAFLTP